MSATFITENPISFDGLRSDLPEPLYIEPNADNTDDSFCITDGENCLWAFRNDDGSASFELYGNNYVFDIIDVIEDYFGIKFFPYEDLEEDLEDW